MKIYQDRAAIEAEIARLIDAPRQHTPTLREYFAEEIQGKEVPAALSVHDRFSYMFDQLLRNMVDPGVHLRIDGVALTGAAVPKTMEQFQAAATTVLLKVGELLPRLLGTNRPTDEQVDAREDGDKSNDAAEAAFSLIVASGPWPAPYLQKLSGRENVRRVILTPTWR